MRKILVLGAGKIGRCITKYLIDSGDYRVRVGDIDQKALRAAAQMGAEAVPIHCLRTAMQGQDAVISALYHDANIAVAEAALDTGCSYFDLTEDVKSTQKVDRIASAAKPGQVFMPQCGLAPGFVSILAGHLAHQFDTIARSVHLRVGALPQHPENRLKYALTWSAMGLINEYCNPCSTIIDGQPTKVQPLEGVEHFSLEGVEYEAFNTSGGLGSLCETLGRKLTDLSYKTLRYPGHRDLMHFLLHDLDFRSNRDALKALLEATLPTTNQDVVVIYSTATGTRDGRLVHLSDLRKVYGTEEWSAIQITTASSVCAILDMFLDGQIEGTGVVRQESVLLADFLGNRFGRAYAA